MLKNPAIAEGMLKLILLKRLGEGKDSAALAKFLITEESSWITGQIIAVDGGRSKTFLKWKKYFLLIIFFLLFASKSYSNNYTFPKIIELN